MADDLLAPYRRTPPDSGEYSAFGTRDKSQRLRIRSVSEPINSLGYNILLNVVYDLEGTNVILIYTILKVLVKGQNLQKLVFALETGAADYIQEFDPARWKRPADRGVAIINSIQISIEESRLSGELGKH